MSGRLLACRAPLSRPQWLRLVAVFSGLALSGEMASAAPPPSDSISPERIEHLQQTLQDAGTTRDALQKSLDRAEQQAKSLATSIEKLKGDLAATKAAAESAEKELNNHADAVRRLQEEKAQRLVDAAKAAKGRQQHAAANARSADDKVRAAHDLIARLKSQKTKSESQATAAQATLKSQRDAVTKAARLKDAAQKEADIAKKAAVLAAKRAADAERAAADAAAAVENTTKSIAASKASAADAATGLKSATGDLASAKENAGKARAALVVATEDAVKKQRQAETLLITMGKLESFSRKVAPILAKRCLACHDAKTAKGRFNVETFASLLRGGESGAEIVPGKSGQSNLVNLIEDGTMPQDAEPLTKSEIAVIRKWVDTGATLDAGLNASDPLIAIMPSFPQPLPPVSYRVPIPVTTVAFSPDGSQLATSGYHEVLLWNPKSGAPLQRITNVAERVYDIQYSPDGKLIAVAAGTPAQLGEAKLFSAATGELLADLVRTADSVFTVSFSPDGRRLAEGGADRAIRVFDVASQKQQLVIEDHADWVMDLAWLPDGSKLVSASRDKTSKVFDAKNGDSLITFNGHGEPVYGVAVAPDGKTAITSGRDKSLRRWNISDAKEVERIANFGDEVFRVVVTADGRIFSCSADRTARLNSLAGGKLLKTFAGHADWVYAVAYNDATKRLATGSFDGEVRIWNVEDGKSLLTFLAAPGYKRPLATAAK